VTFVEQSREEAHAQMVRFMPPPAVAVGTLAVLGTPTPEEQAVGTDVARLLGRPAAPFSAWAARNVAAFRLCPRARP
jgi:hypothetical protein